MAAFSSIIAAVGVGASLIGASKQQKAANQANQQAKEANDAQLEIARRQEDRADEQWNTFKENYQPEQLAMLKESKGIGSIANQNHNAQEAAADVAAGFAGAREQLAETPGLNPNSDAYLRQANRINLTEAATSAAAQSGARQQTRTAGEAARRDAVSIGSGLPGTSSALLSQAGSGFNSAAGFSARQAAADQGRADSSFGAAGRVIGGLSANKGFTNWMNGGSAGSSGTPPNPFVGGIPQQQPMYAPATTEELQLSGANAFA